MHEPPDVPGRDRTATRGNGEGEVQREGGALTLPTEPDTKVPGLQDDPADAMTAPGRGSRGRSEIVSASFVDVLASHRRKAAATTATTTCTAMPITRMWSLARCRIGAPATIRSTTSCPPNARTCTRPSRPASREKRSDHHGRHPGERQDECRLRHRGQVLVARPLQDERTMVWVRDGDQVGEHVTEDQAGHGEPERREAAELGCFSHVLALSSG